MMLRIVNNKAMLQAINSVDDTNSFNLEPLTIDKIEQSLLKMNFSTTLYNNIKQRISEIKKCMDAKANLAFIVLAGGLLEAVLLNIAESNLKKFNQAKKAPKDKKSGGVLKFQNWTLNNFINVAHELNIIDFNINKFSHTLREFRNHIHPAQQEIDRFYPNDQTVKLSYDVLLMGLTQLSDNCSLLS